jgi:DNA-directed RNA polymerase specialized sigma24 family protein
VGSVDDYRGVAPQDRVGEALDVAGFEVLYGRLLPVVYGYFLRRVGGVPLAEDLTQEAFLSAVRSLPAAIESPEGWMVTIARRRFIDHLRREGRNPQVVAMSVDVVGGGLAPRLEPRRAAGDGCAVTVGTIAPPCPRVAPR